MDGRAPILALRLERAMIAPPLLPPQTGLDDDDSLKRVHLRLWQVGWSSVVVLICVWVMTLGWIQELWRS